MDFGEFALASCGTSGNFIIYIPKRIYYENGLSYNGSGTIKIVGKGNALYGTDVVIKGHGSDMTKEKTRSLFAINSGNIILENLTFASDYNRIDNPGVKEMQAEVLIYI